MSPSPEPTDTGDAPLPVRGAAGGPRAAPRQSPQASGASEERPFGISPTPPWNKETAGQPSERPEAMPAQKGQLTGTRRLAVAAEEHEEWDRYRAPLWVAFVLPVVLTGLALLTLWWVSTP